MFEQYNKDLKYLVAVSAGPDSMALLDMLHKDGFNLVVCHVNYKTREDSDKEENIVRNYCKDNNIKIYVSIYHDNSKGSFEDKARKFRYNFFADIYKKENASGLFVAHHKDDTIETYLLKKQRNVINESYLIMSYTIINKMNVYRPLLDNYYKEDLLKYCQDNNIEYGIDITNFEDITPRNIIRKELKNKDKEAIYQEALQADKLLKETRKKVKEFIKFYPVYTISLLKDKDDLFLSIFLYELCNSKYKKYINNSYLLSLKDFFNSSKSNIKRNVYKNYYLVKKYETICFEFIDEMPFSYTYDSLVYESTKDFTLKDNGLKMQGIYVTDDDFPITIRSYKKDDVIKLKEGTKKVSRLFIDKKVPLDERIKVPIIENKNHEIIFVTGLYRKYGYKYIKNNLFVLK